jgi:hypothetical protein
MALSITHSYVSAVPDAGDASLVQPSDWNDTHDIAGLGTGVETFLGTPSSANLASAVTDETGSGALVFANTPTLVTPALGAATGTSVVLSGKLEAASIELGHASANTLTASGGVLSIEGVAVLASSASGVQTFLTTPSSANLASAVTDETGSGALVFANTPTLVTPELGAATGTSVVLSGKLEAATIELGHASANTLSASSGVLSIEGTVLIKGGTHTIWVPAGAMITATTSGAATASLEAATNDQNYKVFDFDASADEHVHFQVAMPKGWDEGTITYQVWWSSTATDTDGVAWGLQGVALSDNEAIDASWGTAVVVTDDAQSAAGEVYVTSASAAVTIAGTPAEGDVVFFRFFRDVSDANDDMTEDARLIGIKLFYTVAAANDA